MPSIVIVLCAIGILLLSWFTYKNYSSISAPFKWLLAALRAAALLILFFLFLNPFYKKNKNTVNLPKFAVFYDNSESTSITKNNYNGTESYKQAIAKLIDDKPKNAELEHYEFANSVNHTEPDSLTFNKNATNLDELIKYIVDLEDYNAAIIFSDGIITYGKNPIINASNSGFPLYTIAVGDTAKVRDIAIQNITTNNTGFTNTIHPIRVDISQFGFKNNELEVRLKYKNDILDRQSISFKSSQEVITVNFDLELNDEGLKLYDIEIDSIEGEWSKSNNTANFSIDVIDSRTKIYHLVSSIHPDVKALKSILSENENFEIKSYTYLNEWKPELDIKTDLEGADLVILHGMPESSVVEALETQYSDKPTLYFNLPPLGLNNTARNYFELVEVSSTESISAYPIINEGQSGHAILDFDEMDFSKTAPVFTPLRSEVANPGAQNLLFANIRGINTEMPLLSVFEQTGVRRSTVNMYGWYKIYLSNNGNERNTITKLVENIVDWTSTNPDNRLLKVTPSKNTYSTFENPIINASLINEKGGIESKANIELEISDSDSMVGSYILKNMGDGLYSAELPELPSGLYDFTATAQKNNRNIESATGSFVVSETNAELINTIRNDDLLKGLAERTEGEFYTFDNLDGFWNSIDSRNLLESTTVQEEVFSFPVKNIIWFLVVLAILGTEWILRKRFSLP